MPSLAFSSQSLRSYPLRDDLPYVLFPGAHHLLFLIILLRVTFEVLHDLVRAALRIIQDEDLAAVFDEALPRSRDGEAMMGAAREPSAPGVLRNVLQRFLLGLPLIGAAR